MDTVDTVTQMTKVEMLPALESVLNYHDVCYNV